jgi:hypothetical protein
MPKSKHRKGHKEKLGKRHERVTAAKKQYAKFIDSMAQRFKMMEQADAARNVNGSEVTQITEPMATTPTDPSSSENKK